MAGGNLGRDAYQDNVRNKISKMISSLGSIPPLPTNNPNKINRIFSRNCPTCNKVSVKSKLKTKLKTSLFLYHAFIFAQFQEFHIDILNENSKTLFLVHSQNCSRPRGGGNVPGIAASDPEDEDIEFVTAVTANEKRGKRKSEDFDMTTESKKPKGGDGDTPPSLRSLPAGTGLLSGLSSNIDVSSEDKVTAPESESSEKEVSDENSEKVINSEAFKQRPSPEISSSPSVIPKKTKLVCNFCQKSYLNNQGLLNHKSRMHKNESLSDQPVDPGPETQYESSAEKLVCCGRRFPRLYNLKRHQASSNCKTSKSSQTPSASVVNSIPVNETLIDKEATVDQLSGPEGNKNVNNEENEEEINRRLFMDNVAGGSDEEEDDDDLEIIDFIAGSTHKLSNDGVKSEPVEADAASTESESKMKMIQQSKYYQENSRMFEICPPDNVATFEKELKSLKGWKVKVNQIRKPNGTVVPATHFLSPEGIIVRSGVSVLEYLRLGGWGEAELTAQARKMKVKENNLKIYREKYLDAATS